MIKENSKDDVNGYMDLQEFLCFMCEKVEAEEQENKQQEDDNIKAVFQLFDKENKGYINANQLKEIMWNIGEVDITDDEIDEMIQVADTQGKGRVSYTEFK